MDPAKERGIIMSAPMVLALLNGSKKQTRRIVKLKHSPCIASDGKGGYVECDGLLNQWPLVCPYGVVGDRLWVKETHAWADVMIDNVEREDAVCVAYRADKTIFRHEGKPPLKLDTYAINFEHKSLRWRPSIFMPRWASRITLELTGVRVERLQEIGKDGKKAKDVLAEGITDAQIDHWRKWLHPDDAPAHTYGVLWESLHGKGSWKRNPYVWVLEFRKI